MESRYAKEERDKRKTTSVLCAQADDVSASGSAASAFVSPLKRQSRVSNSAHGAPESASKKSATFGDNPIAEVRLVLESTKTDAAEEASAAVESPKRKRKVVSVWNLSTRSRDCASSSDDNSDTRPENPGRDPKDMPLLSADDGFVLSHE